jgi:transposase
VTKKPNYEPELKQKILRLHLEEGRTQKSLTEEDGLGQGTISYWLKQHRKECQSNPQLQEQTDAYEENKRLRQELAEKEKEIAFLKKAVSHAHFDGHQTVIV